MTPEALGVMLWTNPIQVYAFYHFSLSQVTGDGAGAHPSFFWGKRQGTVGKLPGAIGPIYKHRQSILLTLTSMANIKEPVYLLAKCIYLDWEKAGVPEGNSSRHWRACKLHWKALNPDPQTDHLANIHAHSKNGTVMTVCNIFVLL